MTRFSDTGVIKDVSSDGKNCEIGYSSCSEDEVDQIIQDQIQLARNARYELEWKVYGHDQPSCLGERLVAAGFEAGAKEAFMVFFANKEALDRLGVCRSDIRRVTDREGLRDYQIIREEVSGKSCANEIERHAFLLENHPNSMSIYVGYVDAEPAGCGRIYFHEESKFAGLYGGQTRERFRKRGLFTQMVAVRIREAAGRGIVNICVDALPTSEPILKKIGFASVTYTQPFLFAGQKRTP
ncbi:MAG: GNAT family N-acetyltransferase [Fibrella sp.]|nr:GNAT family N-acetyltransferase [Armatimonadota bacterium]